MNFFSLLKSAINKFFGKNETVVSHEMQTQSELWHDIYTNNGIWLKNDVISLRLPTAITSELSRLVFTESEITTDEKSPYKAIIDDFTSRLDDEFETALAFGGMMFKPYLSHGKIFIDMIRADCFAPVAFVGKTMTSAIFISKKTVGNACFTLIEYHDFNAENRAHTIKNKVCKSLNSEIIGWECSFSEVPEWSGLVAEITFTNVEKPLFSYFRVPSANDIDLDSPLGVSVYARAVDLIRQADEQWARIEWEYESKETALDVGMDMIKENALPKRKKRIYRKYDVDNLDGNFYNIFSPEIRDTAQFNYFNRILQRIEFNCGLAYGTLSDPQTVEKTAEEIRTSKQRSYTQVSAIQRNLETAINDLFYAVSVYAKIGGISSENAEITCTWGDSVLEDTDKEFQRRLQMVNSGILTKEKFISWYFHCDENQASNYIPQADALFGGI
ncbi:MAG: phage portal protein [Ruminococcus sp.]|nr:phage portal protein [Ruminococcus sp.]